MEAIRLTFKRHPKTAWFCAALLALCVLVIATNQVLELLTTLGIMKGKR